MRMPDDYEDRSGMSPTMVMSIVVVTLFVAVILMMVLIINNDKKNKPFYQRTAEQKPSHYKGDGTKPLKDSTFGTAAKSSTPTKRKRDSFFELDTLDSL